MFVKCLFVCSTNKCDCDSYFLTTTKTEHSRILKYEMGIFSEIVRLIYSSVYFFKVTHFKGRFLKFRRYQNFANLFSKLSETTFYKEVSFSKKYRV